MANVLGISCFYHDSAAALLMDGKLVAAAEEERFSRRKHDSGWPALAIDFALRKGGITPNDLDAVVFYEKPARKFHRILMTSIAEFPRSRGFFRESMGAWLGEKLWMKGLISSRLGLPNDKILFSEHHLSHAASAFLASPYDSAAVVTIDGVGEWTTSTIGRARTVNGSTSIDLELENIFPHSIGLLYSAFTAFLGFRVNEGEYKVMGMAPYGKPRYLDDVRKVARIDSDGFVELDLSFFSHHYHLTRTYTDKFVRLFGPPRPYGSDGLADPRWADIAASIQAFTEEALIKTALKAHEMTGEKRLVLSGGVALNSVANYKILRETPFEEIFIQPAAGDSGAALGAALYADHVILGNPRRFRLDHAYWGEEYDDEKIARYLDENGIRHIEARDDEEVHGRIIDRIKMGQVVGWYQGRFEWGPRALGNRSILADARKAEMKDVVNAKIKFREPFRPFAPSVIMPEVTKHFDIDEPERHQPSRYMLYVTPITSDAIPAVTHVDGSGRLQAVERETNPRYFDLIKAFGDETGVGVLLNTSFNLKGEAIVNTPENAYSTFSRCEMDMLVMGRRIVYKDGA